jgi:hypothetical protein
MSQGIELDSGDESGYRAGLRGMSQGIELDSGG